MEFVEGIVVITNDDQVSLGTETSSSHSSAAISVLITIAN